MPGPCIQLRTHVLLDLDLGLGPTVTNSANAYAADMVKAFCLPSIRALVIVPGYVKGAGARVRV